MSIRTIACSNIKSQNYQRLNRRSKVNATWDNIVDIDVNAGDMLNVESTTLHLRGISSDATIELLGEDNLNGVSDSKVGMRFIPYVCDTGWNTVALPAVCTRKNLTYPLSYSNNAYPEIQNLDNNQWFYAASACRAYDDNGAFNEGELDTYEGGYTTAYNFNYSDSQDDDARRWWSSPYGSNLRTLYTEKPADGSWNSISGHKYTVLDSNYKGPYRSDANGSFFSGEDDCKPMYMDVKLDVNAPLYESPSTIADRINAQLNTSDVYGADSTAAIRDAYSQKQILPSLTGNLMKLRQVNGYNESNDEGRRNLWGNMAVRDLGKWQGIHALMRCDIAFGNNAYYNTNQSYKIYQPVFYMPRATMNGEAFYPHTTQTIKFSYIPYDQQWGTSTFTSSKITKTVYYGTFRQYQLFTTNMQYTEANLKRIQTYMRNTEKYDGTYTDNEDTDINNWRSHWDVGQSRQAPTNTAHTRSLYYLSQGNFNIAGDDAPDMRPYAYSFPHHPAESLLQKDGMAMLASSRSDFPDVGYTKMYRTDEGVTNDPNNDDDPEVMNGLYKIAVMAVPPTHYFKENKNKDASIAFYSKYDKSWRDKVVLGEIDATDVQFEDDSLSQQYNVGCYPVTIHSNNLPEQTYNIQDTYWLGKFTTGPAEFQTWLNGQNEGFCYKFEAGHDADHQQYGGLSLYVWDWETEQWNVQQDVYIYSYQNHTVKDGRDPVQDVAFDGIHKVDLEGSVNQFVIDFANDKRFIMVFWDTDNLSHCNMYQLNGFAGNGYYPFGADPEEWSPPYPPQEYEVRVTDMYVTSSNPGSVYYGGNATGVNDQLPQVEDNPANQSETVCAFLLYRDSATPNANGSWNISEEFALPIMHQGMFCVSPSFMDNPAVWMVNSGQYDENTSQDNSNINYVVVGSNNCTFGFDNSVSRCTFTNLHTTKRLGLQDMPIDDKGDVTTTNIGQEVVKVNDNIIQRGYLWEMLKTYNSDSDHADTFTADGPQSNYLLNYAIGGVSIYQIYGQSSTNNSTSIDDMTLLTKDNWGDSLLFKLGFEYEDLLPKFGLPTNIYDYSKVNSLDPALRYEKLKPLSTNPLIDISSAVDLPQQDFTKTDSAGAGDPLYTLSIAPLQPINLDGSISEKIVASNLPIKQSTPFYLIYCNLSNGEFIENQDTFNIIGTVHKKFIAGDFIYGEPSEPIEMKIPKKITRIQIQIRDNKGDVVSLDDNSTVLFRLVSGQQSK